MRRWPATGAPAHCSTTVCGCLSRAKKREFGRIMVHWPWICHLGRCAIVSSSVPSLAVLSVTRLCNLLGHWHSQTLATRVQVVVSHGTC